MPQRGSNVRSLERFLDFEEQCHIEIQLLQEIVTELQHILQEVDKNISTNTIISLRNRAAAANFSQSFYNGIENILKRTSKYNGIVLPSNEHWHSELAERFTERDSSEYGLPVLLTAEIVAPMTILRRFRHVIMHGYAMNLDWERMRQNVELIPHIFPIFHATLNEYLQQEKNFFT